MRKNKKHYDRASGILLHISSLPGEYGIGDLGPAAYDFIDFLSASGQRYWQFLPVGPVGNLGWSPYMSLSSMAGNPLLISPDFLQKEGLLDDDDLIEKPKFSQYKVDFELVAPYKKNLLRQAFARFDNYKGVAEFNKFCASSHWLESYALFMSIREDLNEQCWNTWPNGLARQNPKAIAECKNRLARLVEYYKFEQFCFSKQWASLRRYANQKGVKLIGDLPIYVSYDSVDVWENQECFDLDMKSLEPTYVAGVPPDYFSKTGQRWGNPLYVWKTGQKKNENLLGWWRKRFAQIKEYVDIVRIDHFRAFEAYWQIPGEEETAVKGRWVKGPGKAFFDDMGDVLCGLEIIAEDLGIITPSVEKLRDSLGFPGMKILQFAFDSDEDNLYLPHNFLSENCVVFSGTHDNDTTLGWYMDPAVSESSKIKARRYANSNGEQIHWDFIRMAFSSIAATAIIPLQDLLGFGSDCRMNMPGTIDNNWIWRFAERFVTPDLGDKLLDETRFYGRCVKKND